MFLGMAIVLLQFKTLLVLKGQSNEIFDPRFFHQSSLLRSLIIILKYFRIWFRFRRNIYVESALCRIAQSRLRAVPHSVESTRKFFIEFHVELHSVESATKFF
jgi:hypothetical protein